MNKSFNRLIATTAVVATIGASLLQGGIVQAADATAMADTLSRAKVSETATHSITAEMPSFAENSVVALDYNTAGFTLTPGALTEAIDSGTIVAVASATGVDITCTVGPCSGTLTITGGLSGTNPSGAGSKKITMSGAVSGQFAIAIVTDDQVGVTATVDPSITFVVGAGTGTCNGSWSTNGGTVALGTLTTGAITSSTVSSVNHICTLVSTNATSGAIVTVKSANASLKSTSVSGDTIPSASAAMAAGTANYGLCGDDVTGKASTTPTSADPALDSPYTGSCTNGAAAGTVGLVDGTARTIWHVTGPTSAAYQEIQVKAAISGTTKAHSDYTDTLTFVATGTF